MLFLSAAVVELGRPVDFAAIENSYAEPKTWSYLSDHMSCIMEYLKKSLANSKYPGQDLGECQGVTYMIMKLKVEVHALIPQATGLYSVEYLAMQVCCKCYRKGHSAVAHLAADGVTKVRPISPAEGLPACEAAHGGL